MGDGGHCAHRTVALTTEAMEAIHWRQHEKDEASDAKNERRLLGVHGLM